MAYQKNNNQIKLSPSTLNLFLECPRCFWLRIKEKKYRPQGGFPSLPNGIDYFLKEYFDYFRNKVDLPPLIDELGIKGKIVPDQKLVDKWRKGEGLMVQGQNSGIVLYGKLDEALVSNNGLYSPFDFKTRGFPPGETHHANQLQMDVYSLLLKENGYKITNFAYLAYFYPKTRVISFPKESLPFKIAISELKTDIKRARQIFKQAIKCLNSPLPEHSQECDFCQWILNNK